MLSILQPISATYVLNRWQAGVPRQLLLRLFVKEIDFPTQEGTTRRYINNPDDDGQLSAFDDLVDQLVSAKAELKIFDILDPVGPPFTLYAAPSSATDQVPVADATGFGEVTQANDGQYHVGNVSGGAVVTPLKGSMFKLGDGGQLYRVYSGQVLLCVDSSTLLQEKNYNDLLIGKPNRTVLGQLGSGSAGPRALASAATSSGSGSSGSQAPAAGGGGAGAQGGGGASGPAVTAALQAGRVSALVDSGKCLGDEIVLPESTEDQFATDSQLFVHVQWRSVSEVFDYLGAVLRYNARNGALRIAVHSDPSVASGDESRARHPSFVFRLGAGVHGRLGVPYDGRVYRVADANPEHPDRDFTRTVLSMLSILVDLSSQPTISPSASQPLRLLPIP